jgi:hypothetical protein
LQHNKRVTNVFKWRRGKLNIKERERERFREMISMANRVENEATHQQQQQWCSGKDKKKRTVTSSIPLL